jgi:hypothetical protein
MSTEREHPTVQRDELVAAIEARRELGAELEPQVIDGFVERLERRIDERLKARVPAKSTHRRPEFELALAIVTLCVAIPLLGIAGSTAGLGGVAVVSVALVLVNVLFRR